MQTDPTLSAKRKAVGDAFRLKLAAFSHNYVAARGATDTEASDLRDFQDAEYLAAIAALYAAYNVERGALNG